MYINLFIRTKVKISTIIVNYFSIFAVRNLSVLYSNSFKVNSVCFLDSLGASV